MSLASAEPRPAPTPPARRAAGTRRRRLVAAAEVVVAAVVVVLDLVIPTLVLLVVLAVSLAVRRAGLASLGLVRHARPARLAATMLGLAVAWSVVQLGLIMPVLTHATGQQQDLSAFDGLRGDLSMLLGLLALSWTLAAVGEELVYRGYVLTRAREALAEPRTAVLVAVVVSSVLFGLAHTEQGLVGVLVTTVDAMFWCVLRFRFRTLWAPVLAHGFNNTIGMVAVFLVGPVGPWW